VVCNPAEKTAIKSIYAKPLRLNCHQTYSIRILTPTACVLLESRLEVGKLNIVTRLSYLRGECLSMSLSLSLCHPYSPASEGYYVFTLFPTNEFEHYASFMYLCTSQLTLDRNRTDNGLRIPRIVFEWRDGSVLVWSHPELVHNGWFQRFQRKLSRDDFGFEGIVQSAFFVQRPARLDQKASV
jgi:hypothetical protein